MLQPGSSLASAALLSPELPTANAFLDPFPDVPPMRSYPARHCYPCSYLRTQWLDPWGRSKDNRPDQAEGRQAACGGRSIRPNSVPLSSLGCRELLRAAAAVAGQSTWGCSYCPCLHTSSCGPCDWAQGGSLKRVGPGRGRGGPPVLPEHALRVCRGREPRAPLAVSRSIGHMLAPMDRFRR